MKLINNTLLKTCVIAAFSFLLLAEPASAARTCSPRVDVGGGDILIDDVQRCPSNYHDMGVSRAPSGGSTGNSNLFDNFKTVKDLQDAEKQLQYERSVAERERQLNQTSERRRNTVLPAASKCLVGMWDIAFSDGEKTRLLVSQQGTQTLFGSEINVIPTYIGDSFVHVVNRSDAKKTIITTNARRNDNDRLTGEMGVSTIEWGWLEDTRKESNLYFTGQRLSKPPSSCSSKTTEQASSAESNSPSPTAGERGSSLVENLNNLNELYQKGILTDEEFNAAKRRLLGL